MDKKENCNNTQNYNYKLYDIISNQRSYHEFMSSLTIALYEGTTIDLFDNSNYKTINDDFYRIIDPISKYIRSSDDFYTKYLQIPHYELLNAESLYNQGVNVNKVDILYSILYNTNYTGANGERIYNCSWCYAFKGKFDIKQFLGDCKTPNYILLAKFIYDSIPDIFRYYLATYVANYNLDDKTDEIPFTLFLYRQNPAHYSRIYDLMINLESRNNDKQTYEYFKLFDDEYSKYFDESYQPKQKSYEFIIKLLESISSCKELNMPYDSIKDNLRFTIFKKRNYVNASSEIENIEDSIKRSRMSKNEKEFLLYISQKLIESIKDSIFSLSKDEYRVSSLESNSNNPYDAGAALFNNRNTSWMDNLNTVAPDKNFPSYDGRK
jgi:hypothetical protein